MVSIKEGNKQAKIYVGRSLALHIFCFMLMDYILAYVTNETKTVTQANYIH